MKPEFFYSIRIFNAKVLLKLGLCLSGLLRIHSSLRRLVVFQDTLFLTHEHSMLDHIMLLFGVTCVVLLTIMLYHVLIMRLCSS